MEFDRLRWLRALLRASLRLDLTFRASWFLDLFGRLVQFAVTVLFFGLLALLGAWIKYCLVFILNCSSFWIIETYGLYSLFDQVFDLARYPITVFRGFWRILFSYVMPVTLVANLPVMALIESPGPGLILPAVLHAFVWYFAGNGLQKRIFSLPVRACLQLLLPATPTLTSGSVGVYSFGRPKELADNII